MGNSSTILSSPEPVNQQMFWHEVVGEHTVREVHCTRWKCVALIRHDAAVHVCLGQEAGVWGSDSMNQVRERLLVLQKGIWSCDLKIMELSSIDEEHFHIDEVRCSDTR